MTGVRPAVDLAQIVQKSRRLFAARVAGTALAPQWWTAVLITAGSTRQAERYEWELRRRVSAGRIPDGVLYLVVPDVADQRIGSGGATLNAIRRLITELLFPGTGASPRIDLEDWWSRQRVLLIHSGGDSRRLPQYSLSGKLFSAVPVISPWGEASTVFDEMLALSSAWAERIPSGLLVGSGDVVLTFDAEAVNWERPGFSGVAMLQPAETGARHGVYVIDREGRVDTFLQKPSISTLNAAGGFAQGNQVALDTGLLRCSPGACARLSELAGVKPGAGKLMLGNSVLEKQSESDAPVSIDLYRHLTMALTGQWKPAADESAALHRFAAGLKGLPFWCSLADGDFVHIGTTELFREFMTNETTFSGLHPAEQRLVSGLKGSATRPGVVVDSVLSGGADLAGGMLVLECNLSTPVRGGTGSVLHGLDGIPEAIEAAADTVIHQVPVLLSDGRRGVVMRAYGVRDDPKAPAAGGGGTWFGRPMLEELQRLGLSPESVWPDTPVAERTLWNARLFPVTTIEEAWDCARWMQGLASAYSARQWSELERLSLSSSTQYADWRALESAHSRRLNASWRVLALSLVESGADIRPLLVNAPGIGPLAETGEALCVRAGELESTSVTEAASRYHTAGLFFGQAGLMQQASEAKSTAFRIVQRAVDLGGREHEGPPAERWHYDEVTVEGPARIDLGGGWSDTPPFCLDWGGTVLNIAVRLNHGCPIQSTVRRLRDPLVRCIAGEDGAVEYRSNEELLMPPTPGDPFSIPKAALRLSGIYRQHDALADVLQRMGGGIEIRTSVDLPMGSGLGTSSILAATTLRALSEMIGAPLDDEALGSRVMRLEQLMTTGGGWQDQMGGMVPGAKLLVSAPGLQQKVWVYPVLWTAERQAEFDDLVVLYYTGIRRVARDLVQQVVGRYLARETTCVQTLHRIKSMAVEMNYALQEGDWDHLGRLLDRHWQLNQILDPHTTNAQIDSMLAHARPLIRGAKLAGAGGGGFLIMVARSPEAAQELRKSLQRDYDGVRGAVFDSCIAPEGLSVKRH